MASKGVVVGSIGGGETRRTSTAGAGDAEGAGDRAATADSASFSAQIAAGTSSASARTFCCRPPEHTISIASPGTVAIAGLAVEGPVSMFRTPLAAPTSDRAADLAGGAAGGSSALGIVTDKDNGTTRVILFEPHLSLNNILPSAVH